MSSPPLVGILASVSSVLGLIAILAYWYYLLQRQNTERSARQLIEGEGIFNADQIVAILAQFADDGSRLEALKALAQYDAAKARSLLRKIQSRIDLRRLHDDLNRARRRRLLAAGIVLLGFGMLCLARYVFIDQTSGGRREIASEQRAGTTQRPRQQGQLSD